MLTGFYIPDLNIEPIGKIKNLFGDIKRGEFETDQDYQKRIAALESKEITFLVNLGHRVDFDSRTGIATVKSGGYQIKGDILVVAVGLEKTLDVNTDFVNKLGIKVVGASESYGTIVLNVSMSRAGRMKDYFDSTQLMGLDEKYRKLTPYLFHEDYGSGALKFYGEYDNLLDADKWAFQFSYNTKLNPDIQSHDLSVLITAKIRPASMTESNLAFQRPTVEKPIAKIYEG